MPTPADQPQLHQPQLHQPQLHQPQLHQPQLHMVWPRHRLADPPPTTPPPGYAVRTYRPGDETRFYELMALAGWPGWDAARLHHSLSRILPEGWFFAVEAATGLIVASAMSIHNYSEKHPFEGDLGWVACDPAHTGHGLGGLLTAHVIRRFMAAGYTRIALTTEHFRLAALKTYFKLGFVPLDEGDLTRQLWVEVCAALPWPYEPEAWSRQQS